MEEKSSYVGSISMGHVAAFLLKGAEGYLLIDTGMPGNAGKIASEMKKMGGDLSEIKYIFITHHHIDHVGSLQEIREKTGAKVILHKNAPAHMERGESQVGKPVHFIAALMSKVFSLMGGSKYPPIYAGKDDIIITDDDNEILRKMGIEGKIICTPGHTDDSMSILLDDGILFGGDACNPLFVDNGEELTQSLHKLVEAGVKKVIPSHGPPLDAEFIRKDMDKAWEK